MNLEQLDLRGRRAAPHGRGGLRQRAWRRLARIAIPLVPAMTCWVLWSGTGPAAAGAANAPEVAQPAPPDTSGAPELTQPAAPDTAARAPATGARLDSLPPLRPPSDIAPFAPEALAVDGLGRIFALDRAGGRIARIAASGTWIGFGVGDQGGDRFANLTHLFAQWGPDLFALDSAAGALDHFDLDGHFRERISYVDGLRAAGLGFVQPVDFALTRSGELLLLDRSAGRLLLFDRSGTFVTDLASGASGNARLTAPARLSLDAAGNIYVLDPPGGAVRRFSRQGTPRPAFRYDAGLNLRFRAAPLLEATPWGQVVVAGTDGSWLRIFTPDGKLVFERSVPASETSRREALTDLVSAPDSTLYLACPGRGEIRHLRWIDAAHGGAEPR